MIDYSIDYDLRELRGLAQAVEGIRGDLERAVSDTASLVVSQWIIEGGIALRNPGRYIQSIHDGVPVGGDPLHLIIVNTHQAAAFLEEGVRPFDLKTMLTSGKSVKIGKDGSRYIRIPFGHSANSLKKSGLDPREYQTLAPSRRIAGEARRTEWGDRLQDVGDVGKRRKYFFGVDPILARERAGTRGVETFYKGGKAHASGVSYEWKSSPFENLTRFEDKDGKTKEYMTFRTISDKSDPDAWIHPGIRAMNIAGNAVQAVRPQFDKAIAEVIEKAFRGIGLE